MTAKVPPQQAAAHQTKAESSQRKSLLCFAILTVATPNTLNVMPAINLTVAEKHIVLISLYAGRMVPEQVSVQHFPFCQH